MGCLIKSCRAWREAERCRRGFTIVEMLVVIGIIGVLMGMLFPVFSSVQRSGRATVCLNNMRQIGVAQSAYMNLNNNRLVDAGLPHGGAGDLRKSWVMALMQIDPELVTVLRSPVDHSRYWSRDDGGTWEGLALREAFALLESNPGATISNSEISRWSSYGLNDQLTQYAPALPDASAPGGFRVTNWRSMHRIARPSATVQFVMMTYGDASQTAASFARSDHVHVLDWHSPPVPTPVLASNHMQLNAHGGPARGWSSVSNYLFLDGHVASHEFGVVYHEPTDNRFIPDYAR